MKILRALPALMLGVALSFSAFAAIDTYQFKSPQQEQDYREITAQLRCPKCQNTNIAASDSIIAADMRTKVFQLLEQGQNKQQIVAYMVARYGNFVTYEPPVTPSTFILWLGPVLVVIIGAVMIFMRSRRGEVRLKNMTEEMSEQERQRLAQLLKDSDRTGS
ncbi:MULTISPECIES: cytochrome c-type biogenesis protein [Rahnella]|jgi:cytochrome c-type biogenesis protein CcmH|uniref:Cytochrome c-type biogenesis protein n=1 Tax=Rahnella contaminans TaxID=2703882 RepID=A0A6M2B3E5_9GAMM|nr:MULTISPECIES: cytochrome c-type biogenesis protein [Rahnella]KAB8311156.1 cytochrome c-type biogenesis protein CcmH [Rouxiella chamberiensis]MBU9822535.1 cytochrome c-type biogenesis protein CcmH [Rahnella sp. BCC 1045]MCS3423463.1 cytochrome c-type biogenesis protein CcmH [Rahnella sp. BIGb0603]NGX86947.1 cytochrome c-type biogenesis protein CcmH [Rahnella contaminans]